MATFETVATFNDKKNGNSNKVSVNIAMLPLKKKLMRKQITSHLAAGTQIIKREQPLAVQFFILLVGEETLKWLILFTID